MQKRNSGLKNVSRVRLLLRKLPDDLTAEIKREFKTGAEAIKQEAEFNIIQGGHVLSGRMLAGMRVKLGRDGLSAKVGLLNRQDKDAAWYAHFIEFGTKTIQPAAFLGRAFDVNREQLVNNVEEAIRKALDRAAKGHHIRQPMDLEGGE